MTRMPLALTLEPDFVEQRVGLVRIELGIGCAQFVAEQRASRKDGAGALLGETGKKRLVDFGAVDAERQGAAEAHIAEQIVASRRRWR